MFMSKVERDLLYDGFKAVCDSSTAWLDLLLVEGTSPPVFLFFFSCEILTVLFLKNFSVKSIGLFKRESNETCREGNAQSSGPLDM